MRAPRREPPPDRGLKHAKGSRRVLARLGYGMAVLAVWGVVAAGVGVAYFAYDLPDVDSALHPERRPTVTILARDGSEIASIGDSYGQPVSLSEVSPALVRAVLATEDRRFYSHFGLDPIGLARAMLANLRAGRIVQGGSTITQQLAKNLFLTHERTIERKVQEVLLAIWLEWRFTKDQILTIYLNRVYLGSGTYGVAAAAQRYFGRPPSALTLYEAAMIAGLLKAPSRFNPASDAERADGRARTVLAGMVASGAIGAGDMDAALKAPRRFAPPVRYAKVGRHFADWVLDQVEDYVSAEGRDLVVATTLDAELQARIEGTVDALFNDPKASRGIGEAAVVVLGIDGGVRALVGGRDYAASQFNRAVQAQRQPGSAFKPFVYLAGLEAGLEPHLRMIDSPIRVAGWTPQNIDDRYIGEVTLEDALAQSINTVAVQVSERAGRARVAEVARRLGIASALPSTPSIALGTGEVNLLELTAAFGAFAAGGVGVWPYAIAEIRDRGGRIHYRRAGSGAGWAVEPWIAEKMTRMLAAVIERGTGRAARLDRPAAGKTGTSQDFRDALFVGYTAQMVAGVWMGNDDGKPMPGVTGGGAPARLWRTVMLEAHDGLVPLPLVKSPPSPPEAAASGSAGEPPIQGGGSFFGRLFGLFGN